MDNESVFMAGKLLFIYDACQSGSFLSRMLPPAGKDRILITSASAEEPAIFMNNGGLSFSFQFWSYIYKGSELDEAFYFASSMVKDRQTALLDADGDGIPNEKADNTLINRTVIGRGYIPASDMPNIQDVSHAQTLDGETSATIWAGPVIDTDGVARVWGVITPPGYNSDSADTPITVLPVTELGDSDGDGIYEGNYTAFDRQGVYKITVYAMDTKNVYSLPMQTNVIQTGGDPAPRGDLSGDWKTDLGDIIIALKVLAGMDNSGLLVWSDYTLSGIDVNEDGRVGSEELFYILKKVAEQK
ncbi:hypothetical protein [Desulfonema magnum]|nr:hypothetical protein [Desulfonema magnum]